MYIFIFPWHSSPHWSLCFPFCALQIKGFSGLSPDTQIRQQTDCTYSPGQYCGEVDCSFFRFILGPSLILTYMLGILGSEAQKQVKRFKKHECLDVNDVDKTLIA